MWDAVAAGDAVAADAIAVWDAMAVVAWPLQSSTRTHCNDSYPLTKITLMSSTSYLFFVNRRYISLLLSK